jgi:hypothetical protein
MAGKPSSDTTFAVNVAAADRLPLEYQDMLAVMMPRCRSPKSQIAQNILVAC